MHYSLDDRAFWMDRRAFLDQMQRGLGSIALVMLLDKDGLLRAALPDPQDKSRTHFRPRATRVLQIFLPGACSHLDTFDYKPELQKRDGQPLPGEEKLVSFQGENGNLMKSPWNFRRRRQCGKWVSDLLPHLGELVDDMAFVHSLTSKSNTHGPACVHMNTGFVTEGFPSAGAWVTYALGSVNDNLPAFVALTDIRGLPPSGPANWTAGFLPAKHQGIAFNATGPISNLSSPSGLSPEDEASSREFLRLLDRKHQELHPGDADLSARVAAYELAARMQAAAPDVCDVGKESESVLEEYGANDPNPLHAAYARNCILARRLLENGVRFVQLCCGSRASGVDGLLNWDAHKTLKDDYERHAPILDRPTAVLIKDLKRRGLLSETLVLWTTEFGRMPTHQKGTLGRDHNPDGFTAWMLGAGVKGGVSYGATDELGRRAVENVSTVYDFHATVLYLLGLDHERLTYYHNGIQRRLTDVHGHVIKEVTTGGP